MIKYIYIFFSIFAISKFATNLSSPCKRSIPRFRNFNKATRRSLNLSFFYVPVRTDPAWTRYSQVVDVHAARIHFHSFEYFLASDFIAIDFGWRLLWQRKQKAWNDTRLIYISGKKIGSIDRSWMGNWRSDPPGAWRRKLINEKWRRRRTRVKVDTRANVSKVV